jgi:DNA-binding GntR family transcriptional regulator
MLPRYETKTEWAADQLRRAILEGRVRPGQRLRIHEWAKRLGVSATPVREAMKTLEAEGYLRISPHRGAEVTAFLSREFSDLYRIALALDPLAAELAAQRLRGPKGAAACRRLLRLNDEMRQAFLQGDVGRAEALNLQFHRAIYEAAQSPLLVKVRAPLYDAIPVVRQTFWEVLAASPELFQQHYAEHADIVRAIEAGDVPLAVKLTKEHLMHGLERLAGLHQAAQGAAPRPRPGLDEGVRV